MKGNAERQHQDGSALALGCFLFQFHPNTSIIVISAKAGIHGKVMKVVKTLDSGFRRNDEIIDALKWNWNYCQNCFTAEAQRRREEQGFRFASFAPSALLRFSRPLR